MTNNFTPILPTTISPFNTQNTLVTLMFSHISTLSYTDISPIDLYLELKNDLKQHFHLTRHHFLIDNDSPPNAILTYIHSWKPTPEFIIEHTVNHTFNTERTII